MHLLQFKTVSVIFEFISKKYGFCKVGELAIQGKSGSLLGMLRMNSNRNSKAILLEVKRRKIPEQASCKSQQLPGEEEW